MSVNVDTETGSVCLISELRKNILCIRDEGKNYKKKHTLNIPDFKTFEMEDLFYNKIPNGTEKFSKKINPFESEGNPQMCLLLPEMFFLIKCVPKNIKGLVIYLGGHPGDHINFLASFFPNLYFKIYDFNYGIPEEKIMEKIGMDPYQDNNGNFQPLTNIEKIKKFFTLEEAAEIREIKDNGTPLYQNIFIISDIRNKHYNTLNSTEKNSIMIDEDTLFQINVCKIIMPKSALLKYRPKLKEERITSPDILTLKETSEDARKLYYLYPKGIFIKLPLQKKTQKAMYFMTNNYDLTEKYYHEDMIKMIDLHHGYERRAILYDNPFEKEFGMETACLGLDQVNSIVDQMGFKSGDIFPEEYCFGCGWDARASVYIIINYLSYLKGNNNLLNKKFGISEITKNTVSSFLIFPLIYMKNHKEKDSDKKDD